SRKAAVTRVGLSRALRKFIIRKIGGGLAIEGESRITLHQCAKLLEASERFWQWRFFVVFGDYDGGWTDEGRGFERMEGCLIGDFVRIRRIQKNEIEYGGNFLFELCDCA